MRVIVIASVAHPDWIVPASERHSPLSSRALVTHNFATIPAMMLRDLGAKFNIANSTVCDIFIGNPISRSDTVLNDTCGKKKKKKLRFHRNKQAKKILRF